MDLQVDLQLTKLTLTKALLLALFCVRCGSATASSRRPTQLSRAPTQVDSAPSTSQTWQSYPSHSLILPLFDPENWQLVANEPWLRLTHPKTHSSFEFRRWRSLRRARLQQCYEQLSLWRPDWAPLKSVSSQTLSEPFVDRRELSQFPGYKAELLVWVGRDTDRAALAGTALAVGVSVGRCFAAAFSTRASGPGAATRLADRLGVATSFTLERMRFSDIDAQRGPAASSSGPTRSFMP